MQKWQNIYKKQNTEKIFSSIMYEYLFDLLGVPQEKIRKILTD